MASVVELDHPLIVAFGAPKLGVLVKSNTSVRSRKLTVLVTAKVLEIEKSDRFSEGLKNES